MMSSTRRYRIVLASSAALLLLLAAVAVAPTHGFAVSTTRSECIFPHHPTTASSPTFHLRQHHLPSRSQRQRQHSTTLFETPPPLSSSQDLQVDPDSLVCAKDDVSQQVAFVGLMGGVALGTVPFLKVYDALEQMLPGWAFSPFYNILPIVLSLTFAAAGAAHFALPTTFEAMVPPQNCWGGLWQVPAPGAKKLGLTYGQYHSYWSGIAELVGSAALILNTLGVIHLGGVPAAGMFLLTLTVTPANIYMFTHNPDVPNIPPVTYPWGHVGRGVLQCALLAVFFKVAVHQGGL